MTDGGTRWLAAVAAAMLAVRVAAAPAALAPERAAICERLVELGRAPRDAELAARRLTDADVRVLASNPAMLQPAAVMDVAMEIFVGTAGLVALVVALAIAGSTVIIVSP